MVQKTAWLTDFQGMNQRQDADKIPSNSSPLLVNISLVKPGTWMKRKGSALIGATNTGTGIQGAYSFKDTDGTEVIRIIRDTDILTYDPGTNVYTTTDTGEFTAGEQVISTQLFGISASDAGTIDNRVYHISPTTFLKYEKLGTGLTTVGSGADRITGTAVAVAQNTLYVAKDNKVYYSLFNNANQVPSDQLWEDSEANLAASTRFFTRQSKFTALFSYGTTGLIYAFTKDECVQFDAGAAEVNGGGQTVFNIGCCGVRAVTEVNGWMVWMDTSGRIWGWGGSGPAMPFSWDIEDDGNAEAVINAIRDNDLSIVAAGNDRNEFFFDVGNVTTFGRTLTNVRIKGLVTQNLERVLWSLDTYPYRANLFFKSTIDGSERTYYGASGIDNVYKLGETNSDSSAAIDAFCLTPFLSFGNPFATYAAKKIYIKYRPQIVEDTYLEVGYSVNMKTSYEVLSAPLTNLSEKGVINMYDSNANNMREGVGVIQGVQDIRGRNISYELGNNQANENFEISAILIEYQESPLDITPKTA